MNLKLLLAALVVVALMTPAFGKTFKVSDETPVASTVDENTMKQTEGSVNGMKGVDITWNGQDKEGAAIIILTVLAVSENDALMITYWASPEGTRKYDKELGEILNSIKKILALPL